MKPTEAPQWKETYDFNSFYGVNNPYDFSGILNQIEKIKEDDNKQYHKISNIYFSGGPLVDKYANSKKVKKISIL